MDIPSDVDVAEEQTEELEAIESYFEDEAQLNIALEDKEKLKVFGDDFNMYKSIIKVKLIPSSKEDGEERDTSLLVYIGWKENHPYVIPTIRLIPFTKNCYTTDDLKNIIDSTLLP